MKNYKNAGIKSKKELAQRLINGEKLFLGTNHLALRFYEDRLNSPFYVCGSNMEHSWNDYTQVDIETPWYEDIPSEGVICWVSDEIPAVEKQVSIIVENVREDKGYYFDINGIAYNFATPVTKGDIYEEHDTGTELL